MKKLAIITLAIAAISTTACSAVAGEHNKNERRSGAYTQKNHGERMSRDGLPRGFDKLDLSATQKTQIQTIMQQDRHKPMKIVVQKCGNNLKIVV